jgi:hypothetical protein
MATVDAIAEGLRSALATVPTLRAHDGQPDDIQVTVGKGAAYPLPREGNYHDAFDDGEMTTWDVIVLAAPEAVGYKRGQAAINPYVSREGASSVKAAIEADGTLGGVVDCLAVIRWYDRGLIEANAQNYWGAKVEVTCWS